MSTKKKKKKKFIKWIVIGVVLLLVIILIMLGTQKKSSGLVVDTVKAYLGDVEETISTSGQVSSGESRLYYAACDGTIAKINFKLGDIVKKGDVLVEFDNEELSMTISENNLKMSSIDSDYLSKLAKNNVNRNKASENSTLIETLKAQIDFQKNYVQLLENQMEVDERLFKQEKDARIEQIAREKEQVNLTVLSLCQERDKHSREISDEDYDYYNKRVMESNVRLTQLETEEVLLGNDVFNNFEREQIYKYAKEDLSELEKDLSEAEGKKDAAEEATLNSYELSALSDSNDYDLLLLANENEKLEEAKNGIIAQNDGIITELNVNDGAIVSKGDAILKLESADDVNVSFGASKYDLESLEVGQKADITIAGKCYDGEILRIDHVATSKKENGSATVNVDVSVINPDDSIYLGIDGKILVHTRSKKNVIVLPVEAVNADTKGDFVYIVKDNIVTKQYVTLGISSNTEIEIVEGINEGDEIINVVVPGIEDGVEVIPSLSEESSEG